MRPITDHRAKFHAGRPTHLGDFASGKKINKTSGLKHKSFRKLSFSGGLRKTDLKHTAENGYKYFKF